MTRKGSQNSARLYVAWSLATLVWLVTGLSASAGPPGRPWTWAPAGEGSADSRTTTYYDSHGRWAGRTTSGSGGQQQWYGSDGRYRGRASTSSSGTSYYDSSGHYAGRATSSSGGMTTYYGPQGGFTGRSSRHGDSVSYYDANGRYCGRAVRGSGGTTTYYDATGRFTGRANSQP